MHRNNTQRLWDCGFTSKEEGNKDEGSLSYTDIYFIFLKNLKKKKRNLLILALLLQFSPEREMDSFKEKQNKERLYCFN